jgi:hypothetical protein
MLLLCTMRSSIRSRDRAPGYQEHIGSCRPKGVSVHVQGAGTAVTAARLFDLLGITVTTTNDDPEEALEKLRRGEIAAVALVAGKPAPVFCDLIRENGLHFLYSIRCSSGCRVRAGAADCR